MIQKQSGKGLIWLIVIIVIIIVIVLVAGGKKDVTTDMPVVEDTTVVTDGTVVPTDLGAPAMGADAGATTTTGTPAI
jgi:hypothetical protein